MADAGRTRGVFHNLKPDYRPQRSWAKVMFTGVCDSVHRGGVVPQCMLGYPPTTPGPDHPTPPPEQTPPPSRPNPRNRHPPGADTPWEQIPPGPDTPQEQTPRPDTPPQKQTPPRPDAPWSRPPGSRHPPDQIPPGSRRQHTVNERPVSILLECILVICVILFYFEVPCLFLHPSSIAPYILPLLSVTFCILSHQQNPVYCVSVPVPCTGRQLLRQLHYRTCSQREWHQLI